MRNSCQLKNQLIDVSIVLNVDPIYVLVLFVHSLQETAAECGRSAVKTVASKHTKRTSKFENTRKIRH